jgi:hypothetical protein
MNYNFKLKKKTKYNYKLHRDFFSLKTINVHASQIYECRVVYYTVHTITLHASQKFLWLHTKIDLLIIFSYNFHISTINQLFFIYFKFKNDSTLIIQWFKNSYYFLNFFPTWDNHFSLHTIQIANATYIKHTIYEMRCLVWLSKGAIASNMSHWNLSKIIFCEYSHLI